VTPLRAFYVVDEAFVDPILDPATWRLGVGGLVSSPYDLSFDDLTRMEVIERFQTLECISNPVGGQLISTARWEGVPLGALLERAVPRPGSAEVVFHSADGYSDSLPFAQAVDETTLIAIGMDGNELARRHGFPARVLSIGTYGMKNPKWLTSIEVVDRPYIGYWEVRGWSKTAAAKTGCRIDVPRQGARVGSPAVVAGIAFAGDRGISKVEVSTDGGEIWSPALLETSLSPYTWVRWMYPWTPLSSGVVTIRARAYDGEGAPESPTWAPPHPDGASGLPVIAVQVAPETRA
jgi:DMSO/TMAO reductase YedYZ molybdopterin-dependent catalytic subunit